MNFSSILPLDFSTLIYIVIITFLFDLMDLNPQIGSFSFLRSSFTYYTYYSLRLIFGIIAALLLQSSQLFQNSLLLAFAAVVTSVSTLESFTLKIGGEELANISSLFDTFRARMINEELNRAGQLSMARQMQLVQNLAQKFDEDSLESSCIMCIRTLLADDPDLNKKVSEKIDEFKKIAGTDTNAIRMLYASEIVNINPEFARLLLEASELQ